MTDIGLASIALRRIRSFHLGGQTVELRGRPARTLVSVPGEPPRRSDPNGSYQVGQLYAQFYELAQARTALPVLFWHGGGMTGVAWEDTPDGRAGWHDHFMRLGFHTCVSDAVERGRASWAPYPDIYVEAPEHRTLEQAWSIFRFGQWHAGAGRQAFPGTRFPVGHAAQLAKQFVPRWAGNAGLTLAAYARLLEHCGRSVIVAHSEGARHAAQLAARMPDAIAAVVLVEPAGAPQLEAQAALAAARVPHLVVWGDYFGQSELWQRYRTAAHHWLEQVVAAGGLVDVMDLPAMGIKGNSHLLMMDDNSADIADRIGKWIVAHTV